MQSPKSLESRHQKVRDYIKSYTKMHGFSPSYREIAAEMGYGSLSMVRNDVARMVKFGTLKKGSGFRALRVSSKA